MIARWSKMRTIFYLVSGVNWFEKGEKDGNKLGIGSGKETWWGSTITASFKYFLFFLGVACYWAFIDPWWQRRYCLKYFNLTVMWKEFAFWDSRSHSFWVQLHVYLHYKYRINIKIDHKIIRKCIFFLCISIKLVLFLNSNWLIFIFILYWETKIVLIIRCHWININNLLWLKFINIYNSLYRPVFNHTKIYLYNKFFEFLE